MTTETCVLAPRLIVKLPAIGQCSMRTARIGGARVSICTWRRNARSPKRLQDVEARVGKHSSGWVAVLGSHCRAQALCATSGANTTGARRMVCFRTGIARAPLLGIRTTLGTTVGAALGVAPGIALGIVLGIVLGLALAMTPPALAQRVDPAAVYLYKGADRDQRILDAAKKEGSLTFYTSMQTPESAPLSAAFEKKYGIKVNLWRATSEQVIQRAITEARG